MLVRKLKNNNLSLEKSKDVLTISSVKKSPILPILVVLFGMLPMALCIFKFTTSIIGITLFSVGLTFISTGIKSIKHFAKFNSNHLAIHINKIVIGDSSNPISINDLRFFKFSSTRSINPMFPTVEIIANSEEGKNTALTLIGKNPKYLIEDANLICKELNKKINLAYS